MAFTKIHYIKIAKILKEFDNLDYPKQVLTDDLIQMFKADNPKFNESIFRTAIE